MGRWNWLVRGSLVVQGATIYALSSWLQLPQTATLHLIFAAIVVIGFSHLKDQVELLVRLLDQVERKSVV